MPWAVHGSPQFLSELLTDDERPLVFGKDGHLEYKDRQGREHLVKERAKEVGE